MIAQSPLPKVRTVRARGAGESAVTASASRAPNTGDAYRLSRIQAEGWNAAHRVSATTLDRLDTAQIESRNPYPSDLERTRWRAGFMSALAS